VSAGASLAWRGVAWRGVAWRAVCGAMLIAHGHARSADAQAVKNNELEQVTAHVGRHGVDMRGKNGACLGGERERAIERARPCVSSVHAGTCMYARARDTAP